MADLALAVIVHARSLDKVLTFYQQKDLNKLHRATHLIAFGAPNTSSSFYAEAVAEELPDSINVTIYKPTDIVMVSVNGDRPNRVPLSDARYMVCLDAATEASATIIGDVALDRSRGFNVGERELVDYLISKGYTEVDDQGVWDKQLDDTQQEKQYETQ